MKQTSYKIPFVKIQAQGNNYIYCDFTTHLQSENIDFVRLARFVSDKNVGIGSDGLVCLFLDSDADVRMRIWNSDGSEAMNCGSALRSVTAYLHNRKHLVSNRYEIKTNSGIYESFVVKSSDYYITSVVLDRVSRLNLKDEEKRGLVKIGQWTGFPVSVGNPHYVIFSEYGAFNKEELGTLDIKRIAEQINKEPLLPDGANIEFVVVENKGKVLLRVWERGSGETQACGTGACAVVFAGISLGLLDNSVELTFPGGLVKVEIDSLESGCLLSGRVDFVCDGTLYYEQS
jgi:diaminopimelate epimerase